jgi:hypothetical protein
MARKEEKLQEQRGKNDWKRKGIIAEQWNRARIMEGKERNKDRKREGVMTEKEQE